MQPELYPVGIHTSHADKWIHILFGTTRTVMLWYDVYKMRQWIADNACQEINIERHHCITATGFLLPIRRLGFCRCFDNLPIETQAQNLSAGNLGLFGERYFMQFGAVKSRHEDDYKNGIDFYFRDEAWQVKTEGYDSGRIFVQQSTASLRWLNDNNWGYIG